MPKMINMLLLDIWVIIILCENPPSALLSPYGIPEGILGI
jgi:hypothetical protein